MSAIKFGLDIDINDALNNFISNAPKVDIITAKVLLTAFYETTYGIHTHSHYSNVNRPLALVALHEAENINSGSKLEEYIRVYAESFVNEIFGLSLTDFLKYPHDICELIIRLASEHKRKTQPNVPAALKGLEKM